MTESREVEGKVASATLRNARISPRKARLVVNMIRGRHVGEALEVLAANDRKGSVLVRKLLLSAVANAKDRAGVDVEELFVKRAWVNEGRVLKRWLPRAQGRATPIRKRHSSITLVLDEVGAL